MITNFDTNKVYLAKGMTSEKYVDATGYLLGTLHNQRVHWDFLPLSASPFHIWTRDYMPIPICKNKFVRFNYSPDYLKDSPEYKPDTSTILSTLGLQVTNSDIIIDGGNVISCGNKVIMTDKIFRENPHYDHNGLIDTLGQLLEAEIVLIPEDYYDEYGHADGMVRYMGEGRVLLNNYCDFDKALRKRLLAAMNDKLGEMAFRQIADAFPQCKCHPVYHCESFVREGGALNCSTWNILVDLPEEEENSHELPKTV